MYNEDIRKIENQKIRDQDLLSYIARVTGVKPKALGGGDYRINPCWCGHNDCCTISNENLYKCFSHDKGGSIIDFYMDYYGKSNTEAIQALKQEFNIGNTDIERKATPGVKREENAKKEAKKIDNSSLIDEWHSRAGQTDYFKTNKTIDQLQNRITCLIAELVQVAAMTKKVKDYINKGD